MKIFTIMQRNWAKYYGLPLVERIKKDYPNSVIDTLVYKTSTYNFIMKSKKFLFNKIWLGFKYDDNILDKNIKKKLDKITISEIEESLGIESVWKNLIHVDRNLVYTPGKIFRYSYKQQVSDKNALDIVKLNYLLVKDEIFGNKKPDIIILPNFGSLFHNVLYHYAKANKVQCWMPTATKISNRVTLTNSIDYTLENIFTDFKNYRPSPESILFAKNYLQSFQEEVIKPPHLDFKNDPYFHTNFKKLLKKFIRLPLKLVKSYIENSNKLNPKVYRTLDNIRTDHVFTNFFSENYNLFSLKFIKYDKLEDISKFAYFPLGVQPEYSTNLWAPIFTNLFELIRQIAISLPFGMTLVVKEHPMMVGRRKKRYYEKLKSLPNVKVINPSTLTNDVINNNNCDLVTVVSGTSGFEAALLKKKVIQFSDSFYKILPNVKILTDLTKFTEEYKKIADFDEEKTILLLSKLYDCSFDLSYSLAYRQKVNPKPYVDAMMKKIEDISSKGIQ